jgi:tripartite-type tricarboxylate transporter receptor subunit TctC
VGKDVFCYGWTKRKKILYRYRKEEREMTLIALWKRLHGIGRVVGVVVAAVAFSLITGTAAADFPEKPVRLVLPFAPGGGTDTVARVMGDAMGGILGQQIVVENKPGAAGNIATETVAKAPADGYTLLMGFSTALTVNPSLYKNMPVDVQKDLVPIAMLASAQYMLVTHPSVGVKSVQELVAKAKAEPGKLNFASAGKGSPLHLAGELFKNVAGIDIVMIPYGGGGPAAKSVVAGETQILFASFASALSQVEVGKLNALAVTGPKRSPLVPHLPTMQELGYKDFSVTTWYALLAPKGTPKAAIDKIASAAKEAQKPEKVVKTLAGAGLDVEVGSADDVAMTIKEETARWKRVLEAAGIKPE